MISETSMFGKKTAMAELGGDVGHLLNCCLEWDSGYYHDMFGISERANSTRCVPTRIASASELMS